MIDFKTKRGFICDMDGVLYHGNKLLPGATEFIQWLHFIRIRKQCLLGSYNGSPIISS